MGYALMACAIVAASPQTPSSPFDGAWIMDLGSIDGTDAPQRFVVARGRFGRDTMIVKADGRFHRVPGDEYVDAIAVTVTGRRRVRELDRFRGRLAYAVTYRVSADGRHLTRRVVDWSKPGGRPVPTVARHRRVGPLPAAGSLVTGRWRTTGVSTTRAHLTETFSLDGDLFTSRTASGEGFVATVGGPPVPMVGDAADARAAVEMPDPRTAIVRMSQRGNVTVTLTMCALPDGRTIDVRARRESDGHESGWTLHRR